ncbi:BMP family lipoprotein [Treponema saccharophilum]|uniref:Nucleoside-binding protein n=1 Tax=Treponema saccharophilum DSM 2985 TaxID=907348 RepID=H7EHZ8_9SPIR|nr:BMP family ABC transporter substrate-binding protein [Treponema saccharophilum]EIC02774.1 nucleoside-binding protein [Treponema saccharophilum DSM 2985]BDC97011.1 membrane protein [Treponema saccharophilum]
MKKILFGAVAAALVACGMTSCKNDKKPASPAAEEPKASAPVMKVAMVTDSGDITDQSFNQTTYTASKQYCEANGLQFNYYKPAGDSTADRVASINAAIQDDYNVLVLPGYLFGEAIVKTADMNSDVTFIGLDVGEGDITGAAQSMGKSDWKMPSNVFCAVYKEEIPGFMAGYAAVKEGFTHLGFLGGMAVPAVVRYGFGFVQGVNKAAEEMGIADKVTVEYVYGGQFYGDQQIKATMDGWYKNRGVEVVFACGGGIWTSAADAAKDNGGKLIGVDTDQTVQINSYKDGMCVTSAMKGLGATIKSVLEAIQAGKWSEYAGKITSLGLVSGTNVEENYVQLPTDTWTMQKFTVEDYKKLVADLYSGAIVVSSDISNVPAHTIEFKQYPNIK